MTLARIGMVDFINTAPLYETWKRTVCRPEWVVTEAAPSRLNRLLMDGDLDLGYVSSHEYAVRPGLYRLLADLSISASGRVGSVFLFSRRPVGALGGGLVELSPQSQTSNSLVRIVLEDFHGAKPHYRMQGEGRGTPDAVLAIGDQALRLRAEGGFPVVIDLGEAWAERTGLPFVFAVWAVREDFFQRAPESVAAIRAELLRCVRQGREDLASISREVAARIPMEPSACRAYLAGIEYDLGAEKMKGLERFYEILIQRGEADPAALPLKFCG